MSTRPAVAGTILFFVASTGLEAGLGPFLLALATGGPGAWPVALRVVGAALMACGIALLVAVFRRFINEGNGTPSPAMPAEHLMGGGVYRHVRHPMYLGVAV